MEEKFRQLLRSCKHLNLDRFNSVEELIGVYGLEVRLTQDRTLLHWMCEQGYYERAESLVKCGADLEAKDIFGRTPLRAVGGNSSTEIVGMLVSYGAKPNAPALNGTTLFDVAVYEGNVELCDYLTAIDKVLLREIKNNIQNTGHSVFKI